MKYNHNRTIKSFQEDLKILKENGYNPIGVSQVYMEDTYIFETTEEAKKAYEHLEKESKLLSGWFYSKEDFLKTVEEYEADSEYKVKYWLNI